MVTLQQFLQGHPKPAFSGKVQRGDQGKFFKNRPKSSPRLKGPKALLRKWHYSLICMHLNCKDWRRFWSKQAAPKVPERPSYGNLGMVTQNEHFLKKCKGGTKRNFSKPPSQNSPHLKGPTALFPKRHYPLISMQLKCKDWTKLWCKKKLQKCLKGQIMAIFERSPKPRVFKKSAKGGPRKAFKKWDKK